MAPAAEPSESLPDTSAENNFQPFFVLHKASPHRKSAAKTRRKIELSPKPVHGSPEEYNENLRFETFKSLWSKTESAIKEILRNINAEVFDKIDAWIHESFNVICASQTLDSNRATLPYPILSNAPISTTAASRQIFTSLLFTKNMEFVDDISTYLDLGSHLRSRGCYVANLTSLEFTAKNGIGGCLKTLVRQFLMASVDAPDISVLASWYAEQGNREPMVVIIDDVERCCGSVLADFIIMLREWCVKVPISLILGVATTVDSLTNILPSNTCSYLSLCEFTLGTPAERMTAVIEAVLMKNCDNFGIGKQVSTFLRNYFSRHDGTLTFFIRALKIAMLQHVHMEPLSSELSKIGEECAKPSSRSDDWACTVSKLKRFRRIWSTIVMCLYEVGKYHNITLLDMYCDMLEPELCSSKAFDNNQPEKNNSSISSSNHHVLGCLQKNGCVSRATQIVRNLPAGELCKLLKSWEMHTSGIAEIHEEIVELQSLKISSENQSKKDATVASKRSTSRNNINDVVDETKMREKVVTFLEHMVRNYVQLIESVPLSERFLFNNVSKLHAAVIGDPRKRIQADLLESHKFLKCSCCSKNNGLPLPSMHDTSILYSLAQEHGDIINVHEWFNSFKEIVSHQQHQAKKKLKLSPSPKKRKERKQPQSRSDAAIQAEFCRAVTELQITGLLRMPTKRRPDFVQRVAFGL